MRGFFEFSDDISHYFKKNSIKISYTDKITDNQRLLSVPIVASLIPLAWLTNAELIIPTIDQEFIKSLDLIKIEYERMFIRMFD